MAAYSMLKCKICGKAYPACKSRRDGTIVWQNYGCCLEHGVAYIEALRKEQEEKEKNELAPVEPNECSVEILDKSVDGADKCECIKDIFCDAGDDGDDEDWDEYEIDKFDDDEYDEDDDFYFDEEYDDGDDA